MKAPFPSRQKGPPDVLSRNFRYKAVFLCLADMGRYPGHLTRVREQCQTF